MKHLYYDNFRKKGLNLYPLLIFLVAFCGYFPSLKYAPILDFMNQFFPERHFIINSLHNGIFPFWNPYQSMGIPFHCDPQSNVFYPPLWIFTLFGSYRPFFWGVELIAHAFIGGLGFYLFSLHFTKIPKVAFLAGVSYMLSGFFVGNAQHIVWIIAAAWLPWCLHFFICFCEKPSLRSAIFLAFVGSLFFNGSYSAFIIVSGYLFILLFIYFIIKHLTRKQYKTIRNIFIFGALSVACFAALSAPALMSYLEAFKICTRGAGVDYSIVEYYASFRALVSLIHPYFYFSNLRWINADFSMGNVYIGTFTAICFLVGITLKKNSKIVWVFFGFGIFCLLMALGKNLPLHKLGFDHIPFFNLIRIPAMFRLYFMIGLLLIALSGIEKVFSYFKNEKLLSIALFVVLLSMTFNTAFFGMMSYYNRRITNATIEKTLINCPEKYPVPERLTTLTALQPIIQPSTKDYIFGGNIGCLEKQVEWWSYNPFMLDAHAKMLTPYYRKPVRVELPIVFLPDSIVYDTVPKILNTHTAYTAIRENAAKFVSHPGDTVVLKVFEPNAITAESDVSEDRALIICQNFHKDWRANIDKQTPVQINRLNSSMISINLPKGKHTVYLKYEPVLIKYALHGMCVFYLLCIIFFAFFKNYLLYLRTK